MSNWTYIQGVIEVSPIGRTQHEMDYILKTVLDHLPIIKGEEGKLETYVTKKNGYNWISSYNEFDVYVGEFYTQDNYLLTVDASLRCRESKDVYKEFIKWLTRFSKRILTSSVNVLIWDSLNRFHIEDIDNKWMDIYECPSWNREDSKNWCEYLVWNWEEKYKK